MAASGSIGLVLFLEHVLPGWTVIAGIGILIVIQEYAIIAFGSSALSDHVVANQSLPYSKEQETWTQVRKKGRARFVLVNTALYGVVGILFTFFAVILLPHSMPLYIPIAIILAIAAGGATAAIRQWNWRERSNGKLTPNPRQETTDD